MSSRSLNEILIKIPTELFDFIYAAYYFTTSCLFTFVREGMMHAKFNSVVLFIVLYWRFQHCAKDVVKVTAQRTILELFISSNSVHKMMVPSFQYFLFFCPPSMREGWGYSYWVCLTLCICYRQSV